MTALPARPQIIAHHVDRPRRGWTAWLTTTDHKKIGILYLYTVLVFFVLEKLVLLRHCHTDECEVHAATAPLVIVGDSFHNFIDGAIICTAVLSSVPLGINTALAVAAHEIPQEVGDVAILLASGYSRGVCFDPRPEAAQALARELGWAVGDRADAVAQDVVVTVTPAESLVVGADDLRPGQHVAALGADARGKAELELAALERCSLFCDEWKQAAKGGELSGAVAAGIVTRADLLESLVS